ncbi:acetolactate synthase small subunit [Kozakia baliensis]|uniref:acetolactate synthase small subunit n=1 Tax=Kozakia baliensis TaxID=153496 RepID=UPI00049513D2|nr:acetolactate synthase small subunit [Kozakia baliensis]AOX20776.1 acetolactate synthase small subunit [Kozakia baliensis]
MAQDIQNAVIAVLIENESGALARVVGLFSGRGYNIESLTVSAVDAERKLSRITIVTSGTEMVIAQIKAQLARLIPVHGVCDLTATGPHVAREMALVKVVSHGETRTEGMRIADAFRAHIVDTTSGSFVFELTGSTEKLDAFVELMRPLGLAEVSRTGIAAIGRGPQTFYSNQESF